MLERVAGFAFVGIQPPKVGARMHTLTCHANQNNQGGTTIVDAAHANDGDNDDDGDDDDDDDGDSHDDSSDADDERSHCCRHRGLKRLSSPSPSPS